MILKLLVEISLSVELGRILRCIICDLLLVIGQLSAVPTCLGQWLVHAHALDMLGIAMLALSVAPLSYQISFVLHLVLRALAENVVICRSFIGIIVELVAHNHAILHVGVAIETACCIQYVLASRRILCPIIHLHWLRLVFHHPLSKWVGLGIA